MSDARARYDAFYRSSLDDPETFWLTEAKRLDWTRPPDRAFEQPDPSRLMEIANGGLSGSFEIKTSNEGPSAFIIRHEEAR